MQPPFMHHPSSYNAAATAVRVFSLLLSCIKSLSILFQSYRVQPTRTGNVLNLDI